MTAGLNKATNYYNHLEAWRDWRKLAGLIIKAGREDLVIKHAPLETFGWRKIDKCIAALRKEYEELK